MERGRYSTFSEENEKNDIVNSSSEIRLSQEMQAESVNSDDVQFLDIQRRTQEESQEIVLSSF